MSASPVAMRMPFTPALPQGVTLRRPARRASQSSACSPYERDPTASASASVATPETWIGVSVPSLATSKAPTTWARTSAC